MLTFIAVILVLGGLIFFHELGHFLAARSLGIGVTTFSLGFGPKILKKTIGKTEYCLSLVPLGGYCALVAEEPDDEEEEDVKGDAKNLSPMQILQQQKEQLPEGFTIEESFSHRPPWQRLIVIAAGPLANFLLAWIICIILAFSYGQAHIVPTIGEILADSPAAKAGIKDGDTILAINGLDIKTWEQMSKAINDSDGSTLNITISRPDSSQVKDFSVIPNSTIRPNIFGEDEQAWVIGVRAAGVLKHVKLGFIDALKVGTEHTGEMISLTWLGFVKLFQNTVPLDQLGGPIMIVQMVGEQASEGLANVLGLAALISINLGILNLLPIPVLDGGHILFYTIETIIRRPLNNKVRSVLMRIGAMLLIALMIFATYNDIARIIKSFID